MFEQLFVMATLVRWLLGRLFPGCCGGERSSGSDASPPDLYVYPPAEGREGLVFQYGGELRPELVYGTAGPEPARTRGLKRAEIEQVAPETVGKEKDAVCSICLEPMWPDVKIRTLECGHAYCSQCLLKWLSSSTRCPMCNHEVHSTEESAEPASGPNGDTLWRVHMALT